MNSGCFTAVQAMFAGSKGLHNIGGYVARSVPFSRGPHRNCLRKEANVFHSFQFEYYSFLGGIGDYQLLGKFVNDVFVPV